MPMDYDDNDTSRHNLQLAGEGRTRSSSALRPYDFPKFDFDDSLQGHLRFDSLVETEVFLGIQSQEDNQWIEDFSRGSNGMEFNPTPADSCSISRRNNIWSEATSSESVEMLLKSVGQEEMMPGAPTIQESDATAEQGVPSKPVETSNILKDRSDAYVANSDATLLADEVLKDYTASKGHIEERLENASATCTKDESISGNSSNFNQNALCGNGGTSLHEGKQSYHDECVSENLEESKTSVEKTMNSADGGDSLGFSIITESLDSSIGTLSASKACQQINSNFSHESCVSDGREMHVSNQTALEDTVILEGKAGVATIPICTASTSLGSVPESGRDCLEANLDSVRESIDVLVKGESELKSSEGDDDKNSSLTTSIQTSGHEKILDRSNEVDKTFDDCRGGSSMDGSAKNSAELGNPSSGNCASHEQMADPTVQLPHKRDNDSVEDASASPLKYETISEVPLLSMEGNEVPIATGDCIGNTNICYSSGMAVLSSPADPMHTKICEGCHNDSIVAEEDSDANLLSQKMDVSTQVIQENLDQREADMSESEKDICKTKEVDKEVSSVFGNVDSEKIGTSKNDQGTHSIERGEEVEGSDAIHQLQPQTSDKLESANNVSSLATNNASTALDPEVGQREPAATELLHLDSDREEAGMKKTFNANLGAKVDSASEVVSVADDTVQIPTSEMSAISQQPVDDVCTSVPSSVEAMNSAYPDHPQVQSASNKSSLKESADADLVSDESREKTMTIEEEKESAQTAEIDKASCGSPTIISSSEPSLTEKDNQEKGKGYQVTNDFEDLKGKDPLKDDSSFTFKVNALPDTTDGEPGKKWSPFPDVEKCKVLEETAPSGKAKTERTPSQKTPHQKARVSDGEIGSGTSKGTSERKGRRGSAKGTAKENVKKGIKSKGSNQENASVKVEKVSNILLNTPSSSPHVQFGQMQPYGNIEASNKKPSGAVAVPTSNLPDLNSSALINSTSQSAAFRQPFTDLQQVQLRAQIFVYGSLIQGTAPDEACMVSAFGPSDGVRSTWEPIWRVAVERVRSQKSSSTTPETPSRSQSGTRASDAVKPGSHSSKVLATPVSRVSSKDTPAAALNPIIPLSSPLWNISTPSRDSLTSNTMHKGPVVDFQQAVTPMHAYQTPPIRNFVGHTSWPSQTCFPGPWLASPQTATFSSNVRFHPVTMTETVKLTPVKDTSAVLTSSVKHTTSSPAVHTVSPSPALGGVLPPNDPKLAVSAEQHSLDSKPRKRKKVPAFDPGQVSLVSQAQTEAVVISDVAVLPTSPVGASASASASRASDAILSKPAADASGISSIDHPKKDNIDKGVACSEEMLNKVAEAKSQAEDAADVATAAVSHCEDLWSQLAMQKDTGLTTEAEAKLASAAVAIAAAASVAKAAAAAAKIACNAALQAKLMADEAFLSGKTCGVVPSSAKFSSDVHDAGNVTPASILKSNTVTSQSSSILVAAKKAAKRRVEAASAASRQAENLDAIVKAAELAAAAVSQAGKIVAMGEPLPLNDLIEAGPEGYWKLSQPSAVAENVREWNSEPSGAVSLEETGDVPSSIPAEDSVEKGVSGIVGIDDINTTERLNGSSNASMNLSIGIMSSKHRDEKDFGTATEHEASDTSKSGRVAPEVDALQRTTNVKNEHDDLSAQAEDRIKEGSLVEVFNPGKVLKSAWYPANVLSLEEGKAYVCYNEVLSEEGSGNLQEWIPLESEGDKAPIIRTAHPSSALQHQQTRKRRRAALGDYAWCVGDRVDVWIDDCWWEGVVTEKNEKDETTLKVHIPAQGETSTVRAWNLRASRLWIDGKWIEWSSSRGQNASEQSDTPQEKRQKLGTPYATKTKDKESNNLNSTLGKTEQSKILTLSTSERTFDIGKTTNDDSKRATRRPLRTNQQKEGSRVVFGVPKPTGKKRKFMEVSKHFPANKTDNKSNEVNNDSVKFAKYLMPQGAASRGWRIPSRNDTKEKRTVESRPRVLSTRKAHRTLPQRENSRSTLAQDANNSMDHGTDVENSVGHDENTSNKSIDHGSDAFEEAAEAPLSSLLPVNSQSTTSKKTPSSNTRFDRLNRGRLGPSGGKLSKVEEDKPFTANAGKSALDASEPRRSNRRIQPTHRLLEGLQSSMVIPKMPSVSHDKGRRNLPARGR